VSNQSFMRCLGFEVKLKSIVMRGLLTVMTDAQINDNDMEFILALLER
jgi:hypothetical protein